ncbi:MAG TPA: tRNA 2-thiouridine(34) synthase MnmA [Elusimicrobiota bacterium]|jgi:tRNA-specific 2-thiouridylase|nr:tRNA 2-thiouridine(34) synthase MnmA [Elusimicrobiota bacterium]HND63224.1 tRNA 2-thiouridine(34) synthase MnmA [Elusimicrobiota bacterium]HNI56031.1 tRNA 2-thiouridine(34) synthase MnmA [Elusimicrobiota bacterium]
MTAPRNIVVAMSGGVDSSVAAALLHEAGHRVIGVTLRLLGKETGFGCCGTTKDIDDARAVCGRLGVPHYVFDFAQTFEQKIMDPFLQSYLGGETPNPCINCNRYVKFDALLKKAVTLGADAVATGHYARVEKAAGDAGPVYRLRRARDAQKDQSYVLYHLGQAELSRLLFPVGDMEKADVRAAAHRLGLRTADKPESMEICFVPGANTAAYVRDEAERKELLARTVRPGPIKDKTGRVLGTHKGVAFYTRGQREGLGISVGRPLYVVDLDPATNTVFVGDDRDTLSDTFEVADAHWVHGRPPAAEFAAYVQIRSRHSPVGAVLTVTAEGLRVKAEGLRAVTPGQAAVFYDGDDVIGGGVIRRAALREPVAPGSPL